jgi:hypothetical protein
MSKCTYCRIVKGPGKRHRNLLDGTACPAKGKRSGKSQPYEERTDKGRQGNPHVRLPPEWGAVCAEVADADLIEEAMPLLKKLLEHRAMQSNHSE